ncbi:iron ABC transporter permease [Lancefieldella sp. Marseille-Q7238]|uniref:FecCD family ABC transporter permease n=1 Tax=Lancefieldella sp. Marseille-Q7238 TaxID=3022127 RepID=UPI0024A7A81F|nr:iron ABC transporter permease [Lancefieldella sp. Marseille-Q7238]
MKETDKETATTNNYVPHIAKVPEKTDTSLPIGCTKRGFIASLTILLTIALLTVMILSMTLGQYQMSPQEIVSALIHHFLGIKLEGFANVHETVILSVRFPRVIAATFIGSALAAAGASYQGLFRNPMVSPDLLGASSGAAFGAAIALLLGASDIGVQLSAFAWGLIAVGLSYSVSNAVSRGQNIILSLVLTGMIVSSMFSAFISIIKYVADPDTKLPSITYWLLGGLTGIHTNNLPLLLLPIFLGLVPILLFRYRLNVLSFGEEEARALGVNTKLIRLIYVVCATLVTSASVAAAGMVGWVGLVIPHLARFIVGPNYKALMPISILIGGLFLLVVDNVSRVFFSVEVPLGILTATIGAPFFLYLLTKGKKTWT